MYSKRLFISLPVDPILAKDIFQGFSSLNLPWEKIKKVPFEQIHLTLKFLGDFAIDKIPQLIDVLDSIDINLRDMELQIKASEIFNPSQPKVLVLSVSENDQLKKLHTAIEDALFDNGLADKDFRRFSAHITLARIKKSSDIKEFDSFKKWPMQKSFSPTYFQLQESELTKTGPQYTTLQTFDI